MKTTRLAVLAVALLLGGSMTSGCGILVDAALDAAFEPRAHDDDCHRECHRDLEDHGHHYDTTVIVVEERHARHR